MNSCPDCKNEVKAESVYCDKCGNKLSPSLLDNYNTVYVDIGNNMKMPINPLTFDYCYQIGITAYDNNNLYEAIEYLQYAVTFKDSPINKISNCYNEIGISYCRLNQTSKGINYLELAISANPESKKAHFNYIIALCQVNTDKAIDEFKKHTIKFPDFNKNLWRSLGIACENEKKYLEAKMFYENAILNGIEDAQEDLKDVIKKINR